MKRTNNNLYPTADFSFRLARRGLRPASMDRLELPSGSKEHLGALALDIFIHASNHGQVFQESLLAVYLSGLNHGVVSAAAKEVKP